MADPNWNKGFYYKGIPPHIGMKVCFVSTESI